MINEGDISVLGQFIINELGKELIKQNHRATGKLIGSLDYRVIQSLQSTDLLIEMNNYGEYVNKGRQRGAKPVPIPALVEWIKQKGIETNNKKVLGIAFAIQKTIEKQGIPTNRRKQKYGKSTEFIDDTLARITLKINSMILNLLSKKVEAEIDNLLKIK